MRGGFWVEVGKHVEHGVPVASIKADVIFSPGTTRNDLVELICALTEKLAHSIPSDMK